MTKLIRLTTDADIGVIVIDNPPVNALTHPAVPDGIAAAIRRVEDDPALAAAVVIGHGKTFISGADLNEFEEITSGNHPVPDILPLLRGIEDCTKPVVMAVHGAALGGGLEVAMAGHYRVAVADAQFGQTEVRLGIMPGASGTQRLPRLVGLAKAAEMCAEGTIVRAAEALKLGLIDRVVDGDLLAGAIAFAREVAGRPTRTTRERTDKLGAPDQHAAIFAAAREAARKKQRGLTAPLLAIDAIEAGTRLSFDEACQLERDLFRQCLFSDGSKALIHVFFGERTVAKVPDVPATTPVLPVGCAGVVGAGMMGGGIAMVFANAGIPVVVKDIDQAALDRGMAALQRGYATAVKRGRTSQADADARLALIKPTLRYEDFADVDFVVEAVVEDMDLKTRVFRDLDATCRKGAILATNTSSLDLDRIAAATRRPESVIGTHFFSPANVMRLLEVVRGKATGKEVVATTMKLAKRLGKIGVLVGNCRGFVGNRMFDQYRREAQRLVEEGAAIEQVDRAMVDFGMPMGPLAVGDLIGLDVLYHGRNDLREAEARRGQPPPLEDRLYGLKRLGQKSGAGWYTYDDDRRATSDPDLAALVRKWAAEAGVVQRPVSADEIVERCVYALVNEGARILDDGYASRASDIDVLFINGYGFPAYRGGPMWYAQTIGLPKVHARIREFHQAYGPAWQPAPLLTRLADAGRTFTGRDVGAH